jgi:hypothetical protein
VKNCRNQQGFLPLNSLSSSILKKAKEVRADLLHDLYVIKVRVLALYLHVFELQICNLIGDCIAEKVWSQMDDYGLVFKGLVM